jgi:hypothetical protein
MSTENIQKFAEAAEGDASLREKLRALAAGSLADYAEGVAQLSAERGLPFTVEEFEAVRSSQGEGELGDEQLADVAGGARPGGGMGFGMGFASLISPEACRDSDRPYV